MAKTCLSCGKSIGAFTAKIAVADGYVCTDCWKAAGFGTTNDEMSCSQMYSGDDIARMIEIRADNQNYIDNFVPTSKVSMLSFDDHSQTFLIAKSKKLKELYRYDQIVAFELLENGETVTKGGIGSAVAGGILFGGVGAIVGGITGAKKSKGICNSLQIKITLRDTPRQTEYLTFINSDTKKGGLIYNSLYKDAQNALSALQIASEKVARTQQSEHPSQQSISGADEILKYKKLLDAGIITEEEFQAKKTQILNLL